MIVYDLIRVPNQSFSTNIGKNRFDFRFRTFRGIVYCDISMNGTLLQAGARGVPNLGLFNKSVNRLADGVFMFKVVGKDYPSKDSFGGPECRFAFIPFGEE